MDERIQKFILSATGVLVMSILVGYLVFAWTEPSQNPPGGNVSAPINVGSTAQTKTGNLTLPNLYLNATANEGNIYAIDQLIGYNDLRLKGNSNETAPIYYAASAHRFFTSGNERLTILEDGTVGIGIKSPTAKLHIKTTDLNTIPFKIEALLSTSAGLSGWSYRRPITINNTQNSNTLPDYQILVTLDTTSLIRVGKMRSDCGDIRFTDSDGTTLLNYWLESGCNTASTRIWVKVPNIPANSSKTIYVYYGNQNATSVSNPSATLLIYEDWSSGSLAGWGFRTTAPGYEAKIITTQGNPPPAVIISGDNFAYDYSQFVYKTINKPAGLGLRIIADHVGYHGYYGSDVFTEYYVYRTDNVKMAAYNYRGGDPNNVWIYNDQWLVTDPAVLNLTTIWVGLGLWDAWIANWSQYAIIDNIRVMLYTSPEPTTNIGTEEQVGEGGLEEKTVFFVQNQTGNVGIGTTAPTYKLEVVGEVGSNGYFTRSDVELKTDIKEIENALEKILKIRGVSFQWKDNGEKGIGLIAQELEKVFPELVKTDNSGKKSIDYGRLTAVLIEAIKEQQKEIDSLKTEIEKLQIKGQ
jgi:hypothetical protein